MAQDHRIQLQRFELKYLVQPDQAALIRNFVRAHLELDEYGAGSALCSYPIHSLYLDSERLSFFWHTVNGNKNRFKLRLRFYHDAPDAPVFFEIKRRANEAILKQRAVVRREAVEPLLAGRLPEPSMLLKNDARSRACLDEFVRLVKQFDARPKARVTYLREAWLSPEGNSLRVTLDREVRCWPQEHAELRSHVPETPPVFGGLVVAEIKFTGRFPDWCGDLIRFCGLRQTSAAKYVDGVMRAGQEHFTRFVTGQPVVRRLPSNSPAFNPHAYV